MTILSKMRIWAYTVVEFNILAIKIQKYFVFESFIGSIEMKSELIAQFKQKPN